jgi:hypothetical protein
MGDQEDNHELVIWVFQYHFEFYADFHQTDQAHGVYSPAHELQLLS